MIARRFRHSQSKHTPHTLISKHILYISAARGKSKNLSIPGVTQRNLELTPPSHSLD